MHCPKSLMVIIALSFLCLNFGYTQTITNEDDIYGKTLYNLDKDKLKRLVEKDSLYEATTLLSKSIEYSKKHNLKLQLADTYSSLGEILSKMSNYKNAEVYYLKAFEIYTAINDNKGVDRVLTGIGNSYLHDKNFKRFDSLLPIALKHSKKLNSELYFKNLDNQIKRFYYDFKNEELFNTSNAALSQLDNINFEELNLSAKYKNINELKGYLKKSFKYHNALAYIKNPNKRIKGYEKLFSLNEKKLKHYLSISDSDDMHRNLATFNYYKFLYYTDIEKNLDSASKYLLKSDSYKYEALIDFENRNAKNGELIYKIINTEQQLNLANKISIQEGKTSTILTYIIAFIAVLLGGTLIIFYNYIKARKNVTKINSELTKSNTKLLEIDKNRLEFFSILSHELRTPIYGISGLATLIDQENDKEKQQSYLDSLISSSSYLSILIDNILQANKLRFDKKKLVLKPNYIKNIIKNVLDTVHVAARDKDLLLTTNIETLNIEDPLLIDKVAFSQVLINLAYNAIRYTKEGYIAINVFIKHKTEKDVTLHFEIKDTGIGIKEENRSVIFSAFENRTFLQKNSSGSGLGLYIVKTLLESHNAEIDFVSTPNEGTKFFFDITFNIAEALEKRNSSKLKPSKEIHVLIVDDNKINLLISKKNIEKIEGFYAETISNGKEAISMVKQKAYDLVLMDINMPDMDGFEASKHIRMFNPNIPILALTALNSAEIISKAQNAGISQIITKPYIFEDFKNIILNQYRKNMSYSNCIEEDTI